MIDEAQSACIIDALVVICKRLSEPIELSRDHQQEEVRDIELLLENAEATRQDLDDIPNASSIWSAIVAVLGKNPIYASSDDIVSLSTSFNIHIQRVTAALLCTCELIVQRSPSSALDMAESLYRALFGHSSPDKLLILVDEYRQLFPYFYLFARRAEQIPEPSSVMWKKFLHVDDYIVPSIAAPGLLPMQPGLKTNAVVQPSRSHPHERDEQSHESEDIVSRNLSAPSSFQSTGDNVTDDIADIERDATADYFPMQSSWAVEEDEDSDGQDYEAPPLVAVPSKTKMATRMKSAKHRVTKKKSSSVWTDVNGGRYESKASRARASSAKDEEGSSRTSLFTGSGSLLDEDVQDFSMRHDIGDEDAVDIFDESVADYESDNGLEHTTDTLGSSREGSNITVATHSDDDGESEASSPSTNLNHTHHQIPVHLSLADLRSAFEQSQPTGRLDADKNRLCRELYSAGAPAIADKLRNLLSVTVTWQQLRDAASSASVRERPSAGPSHSSVKYNREEIVEKDNGYIPGEQLLLAKSTTRRADNTAAMSSGSRISVASLLRRSADEGDDEGDEVVSNGDSVLAAGNTNKTDPSIRHPAAASSINSRENKDSVLMASRGDDRAPLADKREPLSRVDPNDISSGQRSVSGPRITWGDEKLRSQNADPTASVGSHVGTFATTLDMSSDDENGDYLSRDPFSLSQQPENLAAGITKSTMRIEIGKKPISFSPVGSAPRDTKRDGSSDSIKFHHKRKSPVNAEESAPPIGPLTDLPPLKAAIENAVEDPRIRAPTEPDGTCTGLMKPPRPANSSAVINSFALSTDNISCIGKEAVPSVALNLKISAPPLSQAAKISGVILEGWLEKKSSLSGFWKKQYYVLAESTSEYCVLKSFHKAVPSAWGMIHLQLKAIIPALSIEKIKTVTKKAAKGREFKVYVTLDKSGAYVTHSKLPTAVINSDVIASVNSVTQSTVPAIDKSDSDAESENQSLNSNDDPDENVKTKTLHFRATDPQMRLLWTTMIKKGIVATYEDIQ